MVQRALRSRSLKRVKRTTPGGKQKIHYTRKVHGRPHCGECGKPLAQPKSEKKVAKSKRSPSRPYSNLCSPCMRKKILSEV